MNNADIVIVGAGHAGAQLAIALRQRKFNGTVALLGDEPDPPYERPPLSKEYLAGEKPFERLLIRPAGFWAQHEVMLRLDSRVTAVEPLNHRITTRDGAELGYGKLVWATGGVPRLLTCPGHDLPGVHSVRTRSDVNRLKHELNSTSRVAVVGGGYIGLEAAAVLSKLGKHVTVLEAQDRVLARVAGEALSRFYETEHRRHGVAIRLGVTVDNIVEVDGRTAGVRLRGDGAIVHAEMVIVGIGIVPAIGPLLSAGATGENGVDIDAFCRTSLPDIFAIGDCAAHTSKFAHGRRIRLESVQNANDQAAAVAATLTGEPTAYNAVPWFWSNQYDLRLQTVGLSTGHDTVVVRGDPSTRSFSLVYLRDGRVIAIDSVNAAKDFIQGRSLVAAQASVPVPRLADTGQSLKLSDMV